MSGPELLDRVLAGVMLVVAAYSAARLVAARRWGRPTHVDVDLAHVLMGVGMAGMLVASLNPIDSGTWEVVFAVLGAWFVYHSVRFVRTRGLEGRDEDHVHHLSHYLTHVVMAGAMLYMYAVATPGVGASSDAGMAMSGATGTTADFVGLPLLFVAVLLTSAVWELDGIGRFSRRAVPAPALTPRTLAGGRVRDDAGAVVTESATVPSNVPWLAPRLEAGCHIAMCVTMSYMLVLLL